MAEAIVLHEGNISMKLISRICPICNLDNEFTVWVESNIDISRLNNYAFASRKLPEYMRFRLLRCRTCDALYANPAPTSDLLAHEYDKSSFDSFEEARSAAETYNFYLRKLIPNANLKGAFLDIGAGDGALLEQIYEHKTFDHIVGIEPASEPIKAAKAHIKPLIKHEIFRAGKFPSNSFDIITCCQTIEHVPDPSTLISEAAKTLKPGGAIFLVSHNYRSLLAKVLRTKSPIYDIEHMQLLSPKSIKYLLEKSGFEGVEVFPIRNSYSIKYWLRLIPLPNYLKHKIITLLKLMRIARIHVPFYVGNMAAVGYKPILERKD